MLGAFVALLENVDRPYYLEWQAKVASVLAADANPLAILPAMARALVKLEAHLPVLAKSLRTLGPDYESSRAIVSCLVEWFRDIQEGMQVCRMLVPQLGFSLKLVDGAWTVAD
jgi:hypothetical protein